MSFDGWCLSVPRVGLGGPSRKNIVSLSLITSFRCCVCTNFLGGPSDLVLRCMNVTHSLPPLLPSSLLSASEVSLGVS